MFSTRKCGYSQALTPLWANLQFLFYFFIFFNGKRRQARAWSDICRDQLQHHDSKNVTHRGEKRYINKTVINKDTKKGNNDNTALTKNVEPLARETRIVTNTSKLLKENYKLRRIIARWKGDWVQRGQIRVYASMRLDWVYLAEIMRTPVLSKEHF